MSTRDERREIAARLREDASCSESSPREVVESYLGIEYDGEDVLEESYKSESLLHLADLLDPTCYVVPSDEESMRLPHCSRCGQPILRPWPNYCPQCGSHVTRGGEG